MKVKIARWSSALVLVGGVWYYCNLVYEIKLIFIALHDVSHKIQFISWS